MKKQKQILTTKIKNKMRENFEDDAPVDKDGHPRTGGGTGYKPPKDVDE